MKTAERMLQEEQQRLSVELHSSEGLKVGGKGSATSQEMDVSSSLSQSTSLSSSSSSSRPAAAAAATAPTIKQEEVEIAVDPDTLLEEMFGGGIPLVSSSDRDSGPTAKVNGNGSDNGDSRPQKAMRLSINLVREDSRS